MNYQVVFTNRAAQDLEAAYLWIAARAPETAAHWYNRFLDALDSLSSNPQRCPVAPESQRFPTEIRQLLFGGGRTYRALFTIHGETVVVLHIRHASRQEASAEELT
jgi:plasmid stabilization system protein ParE